MSGIDVVVVWGTSEFLMRGTFRPNKYFITQILRRLSWIWFIIWYLFQSASIFCPKEKYTLLMKVFILLFKLCISISCPSGWVEEDRYCLKVNFESKIERKVKFVFSICQWKWVYSKRVKDVKSLVQLFFFPNLSVNTSHSIS